MSGNYPHQKLIKLSEFMNLIDIVFQAKKARSQNVPDRICNFLFKLFIQKNRVICIEIEKSLWYHRLVCHYYQRNMLFCGAKVLFVFQFGFRLFFLFIPMVFIQILCKLYLLTRYFVIFKH